MQILVVEDEALVSMLLEDMLEDLGHVVVGPAGSLNEALALAGEDARPIDVALLDVNLRGAPSYPVAELLKARGVPIVFTTGHGDAGWDGAPGAPVLTKPYDIGQLDAALKRALATDATSPGRFSAP